MNNDEENFITSEIPISGQLGMTDKQAPKAPGLPKTSGGQPHYTVQQQSQPAPSGLLPTTGEFQRVGGFIFVFWITLFRRLYECCINNLSFMSDHPL